MGFPEWTLWGMGSSLAGALFFLVLALLGQSPGVLKRVGLSGARLDLRVRAFTGYAFALLLLLVGFFLAGVPLTSFGQGEALAEQITPSVETPTEGTSPIIGEAQPADTALTVTVSTPLPATPETGAFAGPPQNTQAATDGEQEVSAPSSGTPELGGTEAGGTLVAGPTTTVAPDTTPDQEETATQTPRPSPTPSSTVTPSPAPTETPTPEPTETPTPTLTPTPIVGETAVVNTDGGTVWLRRSPGGQNTAILNDGDLVIVLTGHANQGGILWQEISTVEGVVGWLQVEFLVFEE